MKTTTIEVEQLVSALSAAGVQKQLASLPAHVCAPTGHVLLVDALASHALPDTGIAHCDDLVHIALDRSPVRETACIAYVDAGFNILTKVTCFKHELDIGDQGFETALARIPILPREAGGNAT